jgi:hypothetical protein
MVNAKAYSVFGMRESADFIILVSNSLPNVRPESDAMRTRRRNAEQEVSADFRGLLREVGNWTHRKLLENAILAPGNDAGSHASA